jgi:hypothetical protein
LNNEIGMVVDLDIYRAANTLVKEYGAEQAPIMAAKHADALLGQEWKGLRAWGSGLPLPVRGWHRAR